MAQMDTDTQAKRVAEIFAVVDQLKVIDKELNRLCAPGALPPFRREQFMASVEGPTFELDTFGAARRLEALANDWQDALDLMTLPWA